MISLVEHPPQNCQLTKATSTTKASQAPGIGNIIGRLDQRSLKQQIGMIGEVDLWGPKSFGRFDGG